MRWRNIFLLSPFVVLVVVICLVLAGVQEKTAMVKASLIFIPYWLTALVIFLSKNSCPWCRSDFFRIELIGVRPFEIFRKTCHHCGEPKKKS